MLPLFQFLSLRYWNHHRGALALSALGVALGIAVFTAIQVANHSVFAAFESSLEAVSGKATLQVSAGNGGISEEVYLKIRRLHDPRIEAMAPVLSRTFFSPTLDTSLLVFGGDLFTEAQFREFQLETEPNPRKDSKSTSIESTSGDPREALQLLVDPQAIAIGEELASRHQLQIGRTLELFIGARREPFRVVSILSGDALAQAYGGDFAFLDIATAQEKFELLGQLSRIDLRVADKDIPAVKERLVPLLPPDATVQRPAQRGAEVGVMLSAFRLNLTALSSIAVFVGAFLIYNAIASAVVRRRAEIGVLRSIGTSQKQLRILFLLEAGCIGFLGSLGGLLLGVFLARFALQAVSTTVSALYIAVKARELLVPTWLVFGAPFCGTALAMLSAIPPAFEAASTSPRAASNDITLHHTTTRWAWPMAVAGGLFLLFAAALSSPAIASRSSLLGFGATFCTLGGFALVAPLFTLGFSRAAQRVFSKFSSIESTLAATQMQRALNRSSLVVAALMVALSMTIGLAVMVGSFRGSVEKWVETTLTGDLYIAPANGFSGDSGPGLPPEVLRFIESHPAVKVFDTVRGAQTVLNNQPVFIAANELPALETGDRALEFAETANGEAAALAAQHEGTGILVSERFKNLIGLGAGETVRLSTPQGKKPFFIAGVFYDYTPNEAVIYLPKVLYERYWNDRAVDALSIYLEPGHSVQKLQVELEQRFSERYQLTLAPNQKLRAAVFETFDQTFAVTYALQFIAVVIAAIGIFEILSSLLLERTRELATLRALGAARSQIMRTILIECGLLGFCGWLLSLAAGLMLAWQLIFVINRQFFGWTIGWSVPLTVPFQAFVLALLAAVGAGVLPARRIIRRSLATALQRE